MTRRARLCAAAALAFTLAVTAACTVPPPAGTLLPGDAPSPPRGFPAHVSRGCTNGSATPAAATTTETMSVDGLERTYLRTTPPASSEAHPLLFDFHGSGSNGGQQWFYSRLATKGQARGYVTITPTATGPIWAIPPSPVDLVFVDALLDHIGATICVDRSRIYAAGLSNGASMTGGLGCHRRDVFAAIGMVAGPNIYPTCTDAEPMPLIAFHGTGDAIVPYAGGLALGSFPIPGVEDVVREIAIDRNHCQNGPVAAVTPPDVTRFTYGPCATGADTVLYRIEGGGHTWPGGLYDLPALGPVSRTVDASDLMLDFFDRHRR